nr:2794_t:CDS:2 [Entrophospora candida]
MPSISVNKKNQKWQKKCDKFSLKPLPPIIKKNLGNESNLKEISSCLGGPIHNLITAITIFENNPQTKVAELARKCNTLTLSKLMNKTNSNNYKEEITKRFLEGIFETLDSS